jgi:hypothetical protein
MFYWYFKKNLTMFLLPKVVSQAYESEADNEYVIRGNSAIMKCEVPSFVADFVSVDLWTDSDGNNYHPSNEYGNLTRPDNTKLTYFLCSN